MNGYITRIAVAAGVALLAASGAGAAWAKQAKPIGITGANSATPGFLTGVSASSAHTAIAVGSAGQGTAALRWSGKTWAAVPSPSPGGDTSILYSVAVVSARDAWAVGDFSFGEDGLQILIEHWNGATWQRVPVPHLPGGGDLFGVAATSARNAWAVGELGNPDQGYTRTLILHWNGIAWKRVPSPDPNLSSDVDLTGIAASSARNAWAVGTGGTTSYKTLTLHWDGKSWTRVPSPSPGPGGSVLWGVAMTGHSAWAVGSSGGYGYKTLILRWTGTAWVQVHSPSPPGAGGDQLYAVGAIGNTVMAVGYTGLRTLAEQWTGTAWTRVRSPNPTGDCDLRSVTIVSASNAWSVGESRGKLLVLHWNGKAWAQQPVS